MPLVLQLHLDKISKYTKFCVGGYLKNFNNFIVDLTVVRKLTFP